MGSSDFATAVTKVDHAVKSLRDCKRELDEAKAELAQAEQQVRLAEEDLTAARAELFEAYPELVPESSAPTPGATDWQPPGPGAFTPIEVDDPDDIPDFREHQ